VVALQRRVADTYCELRIAERRTHQQMSTLFRSVFSVAILLLAFGLLTEAFHLMNQPSDRALMGGIAMILGLVLAVPMVLHTLWRRI